MDIGVGMGRLPAGTPGNGSGDYTRICEVSMRLGAARTTGELATVLAEVVSGYSMFDLQVIGGRLNREVENLPSPYREQIRPYFIEQFFGMHHSLLQQHRSGVFHSMDAPIRNPGTFRAFCEMVPQGCYSWDDGHAGSVYSYVPLHRLFYYLLSGYAMFVLDRPGHPVGTPFPGGFRVEEQQGSYLCPIRDKEKDVFFSICNFCPAKQSDVP
jgi:uncharacterized protein (UPF0305 family)